MEQKDLATILAEHAANLEFEDIPQNAVEATKKSILDTIGSIIAAGSIGMEGCKEIVDMTVEGGGKEESAILGFGLKVPCWMAAFANGGLSHGIDYDDALDSGFIHPSVTTVPGALAMVERVGKVSGKEFIVAIALGNDLIVRLGNAMIQHPGGYARDWRPSTVFGLFSGTMACGRLLKFDTVKMRDALGIAFTMAAGTMQTSYGTCTIRSLYPAFVGQQTVLSALLAEKGITGTQLPFEGKSGLLNIYYDDKCNREILLCNLGKRFEGIQACFKPWPSCRVSHAYIDATVNLMKKHDVPAEDITDILLYVGDRAQPLCEPIESRSRPSTVSAAKFSIPFLVASTIVRGSPVIGHLTAEGIKDEKTVELAMKVRYVFSDVHDRRDGMPPARIDITDRNGNVYSEEMKIAYGNPQKPISTEDLIAKFRDCLQYAVKPIPQETQEKVISMLLDLENVEDVREIIALLG